MTPRTDRSSHSGRRSIFTSSLAWPSPPTCFGPELITGAGAVDGVMGPQLFRRRRADAGTLDDQSVRSWRRDRHWPDHGRSGRARHGRNIPREDLREARGDDRRAVIGRPRPALCLVTDRHRLAPGARTAREALRALEAQLTAAIAAGIDLIQIRERDLEAGVLAGFVRRMVAQAQGHPTAIVVNDRADVAIVSWRRRRSPAIGWAALPSALRIGPVRMDRRPLNSFACRGGHARARGLPARRHRVSQ